MGRADYYNQRKIICKIYFYLNKRLTGGKILVNIRSRWINERSFLENTKRFAKLGYNHESDNAQRCN
jgi:hypothetical protein